MSIVDFQRSMYQPHYKSLKVGGNVRLKDSYLRAFAGENGRVHTLNGKVGVLISCGEYQAIVRFEPSALHPDGLRPISPANIEPVEG